MIEGNNPLLEDSPQVFYIHMDSKTITQVSVLAGTHTNLT